MERRIPKTTIYYIVDYACCWIDPAHHFKRNWFRDKADAEERMNEFNKLYPFTNNRYDIRTVDYHSTIVDSLMDTHIMNTYDNEISDLILRDTKSGIEAKEILEENPEHYKDVDTIIYNFKQYYRSITYPSVKIPAVTPDVLKEFIAPNVQPYELAHFYKAIDNYFSL